MSEKTRALCRASVVLLVAALALPAATLGQEMTFQLDPLVFGVLEADVDTASARFEEYRDLGSGFWMPTLRLYGDQDQGDRFLRFDAMDVGRDHARYTLGYGVWGDYRLTVDYNKIPHRFGNNAPYLFDRTAPGRLEIPDPVQEAIGSSNLSDEEIYGPLFASGDRIDLGLVRNRTRIALDLGGTWATSWSVEYTHEGRSGTRPLAGSFGFGLLTEIQEPIEYDTTGATIQGEWNTAKGGLQFGLAYSQFENDIDTVIWDHPERLHDAANGSGVGVFDLAPDNESSTLFARGRIKVGDAWRVHGSFALTELTQDDDLQPYTINPLVIGEDFHTGAEFQASNRANLPQSSADQEVDVLHLTLGADGQLADDWNLGISYRLDDYDNKSGRIEFDGYVRFFAGWSDTARITVPYAYTTERVGVELGWTPSRNHSVELTYDLESWDREFRETKTTDEDIIGLRWTGRFDSDVTVRAGYELSDRTYDHYEVEAQEASFVEPEGINNQPTLRKFAQANRERDRLWARAELVFAEIWNLNLGVASVDEEYPDSEFGLVSDDFLEYDFEIGYAPGGKVSCFFFGHIADREVFQRARQSGRNLSTSPLDDWELTLDEANNTFGLVVTANPRDRWTFTADGRYAESDGEADFFTPPGGSPDFVEGFDNYEDIELVTVSLKVDHELSERAAIGVWYLYEDFTIDSFILQGLQNILPGALVLDAENGDYEANVFGLSLKVGF